MNLLMWECIDERILLQSYDYYSVVVLAGFLTNKSKGADNIATGKDKSDSGDSGGDDPTKSADSGTNELTADWTS